MTVDELKGLLGKVTPGPWVWQVDDECLVGPEQIVLVQDDEGRMSFAQYPDGKHFDNANLIALSPQIAAALIEATKYAEDAKRMAEAGYPVSALNLANQILSRIDAILEGRMTPEINTAALDRQKQIGGK